jgi:hypothetical protein
MGAGAVGQGSVSVLFQGVSWTLPQWTPQWMNFVTGLWAAGTVQLTSFLEQVS